MPSKVNDSTYRVLQRCASKVTYPAWEQSSPVWEWAVIGPKVPWAFGEVVGVFAEEKHANLFALVMNATIP